MSVNSPSLETTRRYPRILHRGPPPSQDCPLLPPSSGSPPTGHSRHSPMDGPSILSQPAAGPLPLQPFPSPFLSQSAAGPLQQSRPPVLSQLATGHLLSHPGASSSLLVSQPAADPLMSQSAAGPLPLWPITSPLPSQP
ncbi:hypothetical protein Vafri_5003, partial [Volvox africanus]